MQVPLGSIQIFYLKAFKSENIGAILKIEKSIQMWNLNVPVHLINRGNSTQVLDNYNMVNSLNHISIMKVPIGWGKLLKTNNKDFKLKWTHTDFHMNKVWIWMKMITVREFFSQY